MRWKYTKSSNISQNGEYLLWIIHYILHKNILGFSSTDIICSTKLAVFWERSLRKTVNIKGQIHVMSKDKYLCIFCAKWRLLCFLSLKYFCNTGSFWKLGNIWSPVVFRTAVNEVHVNCFVDYNRQKLCVHVYMLHNLNMLSKIVWIEKNKWKPLIVS